MPHSAEGATRDGATTRSRSPWEPAPWWHLPRRSAEATGGSGRGERAKRRARRALAAGARAQKRALAASARSKKRALAAGARAQKRALGAGARAQKRLAALSPPSQRQAGKRASAAEIGRARSTESTEIAHMHSTQGRTITLGEGQLWVADVHTLEVRSQHWPEIRASAKLAVWLLQCRPEAGHFRHGGASFVGAVVRVAARLAGRVGCTLRRSGSALPGRLAPALPEAS